MNILLFVGAVLLLQTSAVPSDNIAEVEQNFENYMDSMTDPDAIVQLLNNTFLNETATKIWYKENFGEELSTENYQYLKETSIDTTWAEIQASSQILEDMALLNPVIEQLTTDPEMATLLLEFTSAFSKDSETVNTFLDENFDITISETTIREFNKSLTGAMDRHDDVTETYIDDALQMQTDMEILNPIIAQMTDEPFLMLEFVESFSTNADAVNKFLEDNFGVSISEVTITTFNETLQEGLNENDDQGDNKKKIDEYLESLGGMDNPVAVVQFLNNTLLDENAAKAWFKMEFGEELSSEDYEEIKDANLPYYYTMKISIKLDELTDNVEENIGKIEELYATVLNETTARAWFYDTYGDNITSEVYAKMQPQIEGQWNKIKDYVETLRDLGPIMQLIEGTGYQTCNQ